MKESYTIREYGSFIMDRNAPGMVTLPRKTFEALEEFILAETGAADYFSLSIKKGLGKVITAQNHVGIIVMNDGTVLEILPKVYSAEPGSEMRAKKLLVDMLRTLRTAPFRNLQTANVDASRLNIFEVFIRMFVDEVFALVKQGLKCDYMAASRNESFFRGKLLVSRHLLVNYAHKERFYVEHDEYTADRPENRLIKAALLFLLKKTESSKSKTDIKTLLSGFDQVNASTDYDGDFSKCADDRGTVNYRTVLLWSRIFLTGKSFTSFAGSQVAAALLFPMELLFESFIAAKLTRAMSGSGYRVSAQDRAYHLFDSPARRFLIKPDIAVRNSSGNEVFILDTKWKILSECKPNYGISQADMYQMYAYQKKYSAKDVRLIYPMTERLLPETQITYRSDDGAVVHVMFVDLYAPDKSIQAIADEIRYSV